MQVIIMRGITGSGKSTWIERNLVMRERKFITICSADHHQMVDGKYEYKPENAINAHKTCYLDFLKFCRDPAGTEILVVDNTNTSLWELSPFYRLAEALDLPVKVVRCLCSFETARARSVHGVPDSTIWHMFQNIMEVRLPLHYKEQIVCTE